MKPTVGRQSGTTLVICWLAAAALLGAPLLAEEGASDPPAAPVVSSPEDLLRRYVETMKAGDFMAAAALMHPEALDQFQRVMTELASIDATGQVAREMFGLPEGQGVASMKPTETFAKVMQTLTTAVPGMADALRSSTATYLGSVPEGELVHVVYRNRMEFAGQSVEKVEVLTAKREAGSWRALLRGDIENLLNGIVAQLKSAPGK